MIGTQPMRHLAPSRFALRSAALMALVFGMGAQAFAQAPQKTVADAGVARDIPDAQERPDPQATYKIVFDVQTMADSSDAISPALQGIGALINTYTHYGVPISHLQMTAVFHGKTIALVTRDEVYHQRTGNPTNPNAALLKELTAAGVHLVVCGQSALGQHYTPADYLPSVQTNVSATVTFLNLQTRGYVKISE